MIAGAPPGTRSAPACPRAEPDPAIWAGARPPAGVGYGRTRQPAPRQAESVWIRFSHVAIAPGSASLYRLFISQGSFAVSYSSNSSVSLWV